MMDMSAKNSQKVNTFLGEVIARTNALKLIHWHITGKGSYAIHISLDTAVEALNICSDRLIETTYAYEGDIEITVPETKRPANAVEFIESFYQLISDGRELFQENFSQAILDDYQEALYQLLYRVKRLS
ncbi:MAG TPA: hypothetical protein DCS74_05720 [Veillonellaceae bacterium]|jgi:DNA-binding ferritin-like protein|nr:hypothetical protein [Veillonellaceae bacterium]